MLELVERVVRIRRLDEEPRIAFGVRNKRDDGHQRERGMYAPAIHAQPRQHAAHQNVRPEAGDSPFLHGPGDEHAGAHEHRRIDQPHRPGGIERRNNQQPQCVIGNSQQQEKRNRRMLRAENDARGQVAERDVCGGGNRPAALEIRPVEHDRHRHEDQRRPEHPADGGHQRHGGASRRVQRAAGRRRFDHFFCGKGEEERHADVVDDEVEVVREAHVALALEVRPDERDERAEYQQPGVIYERFCRLAHFCRRRRRHREVTL